MKDTQHTPGPWHADFGSSEEDGGALIHAKGNMCIAQTFPQRVIGGGSSFEELQRAAICESRANSQLIAAAPDMLSVLQAIANGDDQPGRILQQWARAAIARATGNQ